MGVDISVYTLRSRKQFYIDREYNLSHFYKHEETDQDSVWKIWNNVRGLGLGINKTEMAILALAARRAWELDLSSDTHAPHGIIILDRLIEQIRLCPDNETFIILSDSDYCSDEIQSELGLKDCELVVLCT